MLSFFRHVVAILGTSTLAFIALGLANEGQPVRAATVSVSVTCVNTFPEIAISAAQGDTVEVTIDNACYGGAAPTTAASQTPSGWQTSYFSSWPTLGAVPNTVSKFTWVVSVNAPIGAMAGAKNTLPYVCSTCSKGAYLRFTIAAGSTTTVAPTTTEMPTTTSVAATTTIPPTTTTVPLATTVSPTPTTVLPTSTTEPQRVSMTAALPEAGGGSSQSMWAIACMGAGILFVGVSRVRGRHRRG